MLLLLVSRGSRGVVQPQSLQRRRDYVGGGRRGEGRGDLLEALEQLSSPPPRIDGLRVARGQEERGDRRRRVCGWLQAARTGAGGQHDALLPEVQDWPAGGGHGVSRGQPERVRGHHRVDHAGTGHHRPGESQVAADRHRGRVHRVPAGRERKPEPGARHPPRDGAARQERAPSSAGCRRVARGEHDYPAVH